MSRWVRVAGRVCICVVAASAAHLPTVAQLRAQAAAPSPPVAIDLHGAGASDRSRIEAAARESFSLYESWLGPLLATDALITDRPLGAGSRAVFVKLPWWPAPLTMDLESQVAFGLARLWWPPAAGPDATALVDGAAWYLQSRAISRLFDLEFRRAAHSVESVHLFGGVIPWSFPALRFDGPTAGLARRHMPITPRAIRVAHAFASLEALVGTPRLSGALRTLAGLNVTAPPAAVAALGAALGQDVSWLFDAALDETATIQYVLESLESEPCAVGACHRVRVTVVRLGAGVFPGRSHPRVGTFESGDALEVRVEFADGQSASMSWDGRDTRRTFEFEAPAVPLRARLDPDAVMLLDDNLLDQSKAPGAATNAPVWKWVARWVVWLQNVTLAYSALA